MDSRPESSFPEARLPDYATRGDTFDLMRTAAGDTRPGWERLESFVAGLPAREMAAREAKARELIRLNGVTYNEYADPRGMHRPWTIDPIPLVVPAPAWRAVEIGIEQRARLLDALLRDLYGAQRVLAERLLPPELVYGNPGFLRPCHLALPTEAPMLYLHGAEVVWDRNGDLAVLADRTQAPSGAAYALENRLVVGQALPLAARAHRIQRLAEFFVEYRQSLQRSPRVPRESPFVVVLTPGPHDESYFEHAYLAGYLGLTLVQGADLAVRDERVYLKTLGGLERVDVILRRVDDALCDPLSLRGDSGLGVSGLAHAARAGNVAIANALGAGAIETRAVLPYLPGICRLLLGEEMRLPSVETFWCGDDDSRARVLGELDSLVVMPTFTGTGRRKRVMGASLTAAQRKELAAAIEAEPAAFVAQRDTGLATAPSWVGDRIEARSVSLRTFAARSGRGFRVMPGGLARVASDTLPGELSIQEGSRSKDCWVLTDGPVSPLTLLPKAGKPLQVSRGGGGLPSRTADDLYWLGRYVERADGTARLLRVLTGNLAENSTTGGTAVLPALVHALSIHTELETELAAPEADDVEPLEREIVQFVIAESPPRSLRNVLAQARRVAFAARDRIPLDAVRALQGALEAFDGMPPTKEIRYGEVLELLQRVLIGLAAFSGMGFEGLTRGHSYRFADMGRRLERAHTTSRLLWSTLTEPLDDETPLLLSLLHVLDSSGAYRRRYRGFVEAAPVVDLLLFDERNPRSLAYSLAAIAEHIADLPGESSRPYRRVEDRLVLRALTRLRLSDAEEVCRIHESGRREHLEEVLLATVDDLGELSDALTRSYFAHAVARLSVSGLGEEST